MNKNASAVEVIVRFKSAGITVAAVGSQLRLAPKSRLTSEIIDLARGHKPELMEFLGPVAPEAQAETLETALKVLRETLFAITAIVEGCQVITLDKIGESVGHFGQVIGGLFARADYRSVPYVCLYFERCAESLIQMDRYR